MTKQLNILSVLILILCASSYASADDNIDIETIKSQWRSVAIASSHLQSRNGHLKPYPNKAGSSWNLVSFAFNPNNGESTWLALTASGWKTYWTVNFLNPENIANVEEINPEGEELGHRIGITHPGAVCKVFEISLNPPEDSFYKNKMSSGELFGFTAIYKKISLPSNENLVSAALLAEKVMN